VGRPKKQSREPYWLTKRQCWYVHYGTRTIRLSPDKDEAWRLWHELMAKPPEPDKPRLPTGPDAQAVEILDAFLDWCLKHRAERTYKWARENIQPFAASLPRGLKVSELRPFHVTQAMEAYPHWSNNTKHDFISAAKRAFSWAVDEELIDKSPPARVKKPSREAREMAISPDEYEKIIAAIQTPTFRDLIELSWETGMRVQELRKVEARFFDGGRIVFPPKEAKGKKYYRVVYLTPRAQEIIGRLAEAYPEGPIILNADGRPWTKNAINCVFCRLEKRVGKKYHLSAFRKGYATEALKAGVDVVSLARLLGHRDPSMLSKVYAQVHSDTEHMAKQANKAKRPANDNQPQTKKATGS
jgi:integrase